MELDTYRKKRDFKATPEPSGRKARKAGDSFVIQKHSATRLHYDLRLEMGGVLKSWAVTRGPSLVPGEKRLSVHVEDHPLDYADFEGIIPKGSYGAGEVIVWDRGHWTPVGDAAKGYAKGHLEFVLEGEKLSGRWHLVKIRGKPNEKRENWLLIKGEDEAARDADAPDILEERPESVKTGRRIEDIAATQGKAPARTAAKKAPAKAKRATKAVAPLKGKKAALPDFVPPALATLAAKPPPGDQWVHEIKFDGYRLQARIDGGNVALLTRSGLDWTDRFGAAIPDALGDLRLTTALIDGEVVVEGSHGASDFSALQADLSEGRHDRFVFWAFDLLHLDGQDLTRQPLSDRKQALQTLINGQEGLLRLSEHFTENGSLVLRHACRLSLEGVISKQLDAPYRSGRNRAWIKSKCSARQEFVIGGYVPSSVSPKAIGSLVLGVHEDGGLRHVGRVGTGFTAAVAEMLFARLDPLADDNPFQGKLTATEARNVRFTRPELVAEVEFRAWTADGHLRHAAFRGLREDKPAAEIVREGKPAAKPPAEPKRRIRLTHPDRIYWPDAGVTKEGLADFYAEIWPHIAPHIAGRPLALLRCPNGIDGTKFFQKNAWKGMHRAIVPVTDPKNPDQPLISINDLDGLQGLVQAATLEIHPWGAMVGKWDKPDTLVMDLDPGDGVGWEEIIAAAFETRDRLRKSKLEAFVKTSGGKGLHVVSPLKPGADWTRVKAFTKALADAMAADSPELYVSTIAKAKRKGRILIDYLRNQRGQTAVAAYSTRARPGAAVSTPLAWDELGPDIGPDYFTVANLPARLAALRSDPWDGFRNAAKPLPKKP